MIGSEPGPINPDRLYRVPEAARIMDLHPKTVYAIPESLLKRTRVGPRRGSVRIRGRDIESYLEGKVAA